MNIKKYYIYNIFNDLMPIYPLYLLMFESKGLSLLQISLLLSIWSVPAVILEIPTGILADRWSRRNMVAIGEMLKALCFFLWMFADGFHLYAVGFVFWGLGGAFQSGAEEALLFDTLKIQNREEQFEQVLGKGRFLHGMSNMLAAVSGGFLGTWFGYQAALGLSIISGLITAGIIFSMKEVNLYKEHRQKPETKEEGTLLSSLSFLIHRRQLLLITLMAVFVVTTADTLDEYDQLIAKGYGLTISMIGIWTALRFIMISLGGYLAGGLRIILERFFRCRDGMDSISLLCVAAAICLLVSGVVDQIGIMCLYGMYYLFLSSAEVLQEDYIHQRLDKEGRATVHSLISLSRNIYGILFYSLFGLAATGTGLHHALIAVGFYMIVWTGAVKMLHKRNSQ